MQIKDFCVVPENELDNEYVEEEMDFLLEVSIRRQHEIGSVEKYREIVEEHYANWLDKD